jgi:hypothetical protein
MSGRAQLPEIEQQDSLMQAFEDRLGAAGTATQAAMDQLAAAQKEQQNQIALLRQGQGAMMQHLGIPEPQTAPPTEDLSYNDQETSV